MQRTLTVTITFVINPLSKASKVMKNGFYIWLKSCPALKKNRNRLWSAFLYECQYFKWFSLASSGPENTNCPNLQIIRKGKSKTTKRRKPGATSGWALRLNWSHLNDQNCQKSTISHHKVQLFHALQGHTLAWDMLLKIKRLNESAIKLSLSNHSDSFAVSRYWSNVITAPRWL